MTNAELKPENITDILKEHYNFFNTNQTKDLNFRLQQLQILKEGIIKYESKITEALQEDLGKHPFESYTSEIGFVLNSITHTMKRLKKWAKPKKVKTPLTLFPSKSMIRYEPYGTVLIIGPFNYPFQLMIEPLIGAIAAGNCVVLKPSEVVPNVSAVITEMIETTFDKSYIRSVQGGIETNTSLINAPFDYIFFTGSVPVGKIVMEAAAKNLVPVTLELGGKSPVIVDKSADVKVAAIRIIWGKTLNSGQTCVAPDYLVVHEDVKKALINEMKQNLKAFYGQNIEDSKDFGRIVNNRHFTRLKTILEKDKDQIIFGGATNPNTRFIEPTLIEATWTSASMEDEIFGPLLPILTYSDLDDAIKSINKLSKPLALYLFTSDNQVEEKVLTEISSGGVSINNTVTHLANPELPFGGVGNSGIGAYHGHYSFTTFSHEKSFLKTSTKINVPLLFPPYNDKNLKLARHFLK
ncbi:Aldehyde dehydrogenase [Bacillus safensis]|uniref:aldehyde dehydrogenase n=1 Tax=Bacillus TaxID=1386 RepID=UPI000597558F|nr:aldehyde dehydrogenase [Bacillus safensis]KIL22353.1 Aldehyde dehydrogenase [Bacillus safensis]MDV3450596.1 aldehyde dehydrogenase [Bacillus safensis]MED5225188.1 aldehyde dehydrogenase [Bacillus safensis]